jgi:two-component system chemotaxis response regulator CheY
MNCILIADDSLEWRSIIAIALRTIPDTTVLTAESAEEALVLATEQDVDVLVTDFQMSAMNGLQLLDRLRKLERWPSRGALVVSGEVASDLKKESIALGANAFFPKPFSPGELRTCVISLLESEP